MFVIELLFSLVFDGAWQNAAAFKQKKRRKLNIIIMWCKGKSCGNEKTETSFKFAIVLTDLIAFYSHYTFVLVSSLSLSVTPCIWCTVHSTSHPWVVNFCWISVHSQQMNFIRVLSNHRALIYELLQRAQFAIQNFSKHSPLFPFRSLTVVCTISGQSCKLALSHMDTDVAFTKLCILSVTMTTLKYRIHTDPCIQRTRVKIIISWHAKHKTCDQHKCITFNILWTFDGCQKLNRIALKRWWWYGKCNAKLAESAHMLVGHTVHASRIVSNSS